MDAWQMSGPILCFGEILWDLLPHGDFAGGAPFNVACHLRQLGVPAVMVSAVGADERGEELRRRAAARGLGTEEIARRAEWPTGTVTAEIGPAGDARYTIHENVAWDHIPVTATIEAAARRARGLVWGSLALRSAENERALERLLDALPDNAWRVFDVNLRPPFDDLARVRRLARLANLLKLNTDEAGRIAGAEGERPGAEEADARALAVETGVPLVCVTAGARGAGLLRGSRWVWEAARPVTVVDTVGAGDAFLAGLLAGLLRGGSDDRGLVAAACRRGEWVASQPGACPEEPVSGSRRGDA
jgi:fructokinase